MFDVVTLGSATKDIFLFTKDSNLKPGINRNFLEIPSDKKIEVTKRLEFSGGSATNAAATFAGFGKTVGVISKTGNDYNGEFIIEDLKKRGISTDYMIKTDGETPFTDILVSNNGHMVILAYRGIEGSLETKEIRFDFKSKWMYIGPLSGSAYKVLPDAVNYCNQNGIKVVLNPGSTELSLKLKKMESILKNVDVISMNDEEARKFVGYGNDVKNLMKLAEIVKETAIITKGDKGSIVANGKSIYYAGTFHSKQINFVGAGDAYLSGFITGLMDGKNVEDSISLGSYNASGVVKQYGAKDGLVGDYPKQKLKIRRVEYEKK